MYCLKYTQLLPITVDECWSFFSDPKNLKVLTPEHMGFKIENEPTAEMYPGQIIRYSICALWNLSFEWVTEITHVQKPDYFIDEQRVGPYSFWHHEHRFVAVPEGVEVIDIVYYRLPLGPLGKLLHEIKIKDELERIFAYRRAKLIEIFGDFEELHYS